MNADRIAPLYRGIEYAAFGRALEQARFHYIDRLSTARKILILGEGDGRFLARLLEVNPSVEAHVVDLSHKMLTLARERSQSPARVHFIQANALDLPLRGQLYDAFVTNFFLDCLSPDEAASLIDNLAGSLAPGALWLITEFHQPAAGWRRVHARLWISTMYRFFKLSTALKATQIPDYRALLERSGLTRLEHLETRFGLISSELWTRR